MSALFELQGIGFGYDPQRPVLSGVDFRLEPGERVALIGPNGAGKTTLLHLMVGLRSPQAGLIAAFGRVRRREADFREVRQRAGLLFQDSDDQLFSPTVAEDVAFGPLNLGLDRVAALERVRVTLERLGLTGFGPRVTHTLSGGEKRLVALATVLAMEPEVLLLDEPTNGLDRDAAARLFAILDGLPQAMVVISHDHLFLERLTRRAVHLERGGGRD
ncbi:MAG: ABC transporter ATP-binding protein [Magnetococcales bacterium]|nr:ABC transporter ATP-binding protein [Magnetococcales bacterium]